MEAVAQHSSVSQEADKSLASSETVEPPIEQITKEERIRKAEELIQKNKRIKQAQQLELERERELRRRSQVSLNVKCRYISLPFTVEIDIPYSYIFLQDVNFMILMNQHRVAKIKTPKFPDQSHLYM